MKFFDVAVNLTDGMFRGMYHGKHVHAPDLTAVLNRARAAGVQRLLITGTDLQESRDALKLAQEHGLYFFLNFIRRLDVSFFWV